MSGGLRWTCAADITPTSVAWLWEDRIPASMVSLIVGDPGLGKSTLLCELIARGSRGQLAGDYYGDRLVAGYITSEDSHQHVLAPRLIAAGADIARIHLLDLERHWLKVPRDVALLRASIRDLDLRFVVLDPLSAFVGGADLDSYRDEDLRQALGPLAALAAETGVTIVGVKHLGKTQHANPLHRVLGAVANVAQARSVLALTSDPEDEDGPCRLIAHGKCNLGPLAATLRVQIESRTIMALDGETPIPTSGLAWKGEAKDVTARTVLAPPAPARQTVVGDAETFIKKALSKAPMLSSDLEELATAAGFSESALRRARKQLNVKSLKGDDGWRVSLPRSVQDCTSKRPETKARTVTPLRPLTALNPLNAFQDEQGEQGAQGVQDEQGAQGDGLAVQVLTAAAALDWPCLPVGETWITGSDIGWREWAATASTADLAEACRCLAALAG